MDAKLIPSPNIIRKDQDVTDTPKSMLIMEKLEETGQFYRLVDSYHESINAERSMTGPINYDQFFEYVYDNFGSGEYNVKALMHGDLPSNIKDLGILRIELNFVVNVLEDMYTWVSGGAFQLYIFMPEAPSKPIVDLDVWLDFIESESEFPEWVLSQAIQTVNEAPEKVALTLQEMGMDGILNGIGRICALREVAQEN